MSINTKIKREDVYISGWKDYYLLDSGDGRKLEKFSSLVLDRPDPQALWDKSSKENWDKVDAQFLWAEKGERWKITKDTPQNWQMSWGPIVFNLSFKGFKHVGVFPEHTSQWEGLIDLGKSNTQLRALNLFGYTGAASIVCATSGMKTTHVDASKIANNILKDNMKASGLEGNEIRIICEDALRYAGRLIQRKEQFEVIIMDPPAFGRGPKGEVWKIEEELSELISLVPKLLSSYAKLVILNGYASGYSARTFGELLRQNISFGDISYGDIGVKQKDSDRILTTGIYATWTN